MRRPFFKSSKSLAGAILVSAMIAVLLSSATIPHAGASQDEGRTEIGTAVTYTRDGSGNIVLNTLEGLPAVPAPELTPAGSRLGLHVTAEELAIWRDRWVSGVSGDTFLNARVSEEKSRLTNNRNTFVGNPATWGMDPNTPKDAGGCYNGSPDMQPQRYQSARSRDAALYGLINQDATALNAVKTHLLAQAARSDVQFKQSPPWCPTARALMSEIFYLFPVTHTMIPTLFAYDYLRIAQDLGIVTGMTAGEHATMRQWFTDYANFVTPAMNHWMGRGFVDRLNDDYTLNSWGTTTGANAAYGGGNIYVGGPTHREIGRSFTNPYFGSARYLALVGVLTDNATFKSHAWRAGRDWIRYHLYPQGVQGDMYRGWSNAWGFNQYGTLSGGYAMMIADTLARDGDTRLYDYKTTSGAYDSAGAPPAEYGGQKSLLFFFQSIARHGNETFQRRNNSSQLLNFQTGSSPNGKSNIGNHDRFIMANIYYRDAGLSKDLYRGENGQAPWVPADNAQGASGGGTDLNGNWSFAAPYLQWAGLEGQIWPYPTPQ